MIRPSRSKVSKHREAGCHVRSVPDIIRRRFPASRKNQSGLCYYYFRGMKPILTEMTEARNRNAGM